MPGEFDGRPRVAWFPRGTRLNVNRFLGLIDTDYRGVHLISLFEVVVEFIVGIYVSLGG